LWTCGHFSSPPPHEPYFLPLFAERGPGRSDFLRKIRPKIRFSTFPNTNQQPFENIPPEPKNFHKPLRARLFTGIASDPRRGISNKKRSPQNTRETASEKSKIHPKTILHSKFRITEGFFLILHPFCGTHFRKDSNFQKRIHTNSRKTPFRKFRFSIRNDRISINFSEKSGENPAVFRPGSGFPQIEHPLLLLLLKTYIIILHCYSFFTANIQNRPSAYRIPENTPTRTHKKANRNTNPDIRRKNSRILQIHTPANQNTPVFR